MRHSAEYQPWRLAVTAPWRKDKVCFTTLPSGFGWQVIKVGGAGLESVLSPLFLIVIVQNSVSPNMQFSGTVRSGQMDPHPWVPPCFPSPSGVWLALPALQHQKLASPCLSRLYSLHGASIYTPPHAAASSWVGAVFHLQRCWLRWHLVPLKTLLRWGPPFVPCYNLETTKIQNCLFCSYF